jgi:hypothetical protein
MESVRQVTIMPWIGVVMDQMVLLYCRSLSFLLRTPSISSLISFAMAILLLRFGPGLLCSPLRFFRFFRLVAKFHWIHFRST